MAVELTATDYSGIGTGATATYGTGIYANASNQIKVYVNGVLQILGDNYSLNGVGSSAGVNVVGNFANGASVYVERQTPITQLVDTQNNETILEDVLDAEFDKLTMIDQEIDGKARRAILVPKGEAGFTLPPAAQRVGFAAWAGGELVGATLPAGIVGANLTYVLDSRAALSAVPLPSAGIIAALTEPGREGLFICRAGSPPSDPLQGVYVASVLPGFYWMRMFDGIHYKPEWYGAKKNTIEFDCITMLQAAAAPGRVVVLEQGRYNIRSTWVIPAYCTVQGVGVQNQPIGGAVTQVCLSMYAPGATTDDIIRVGTINDPRPGGSGDPEGPNGFLCGVTLRDFEAIRESAPSLGVTQRDNPAGIRVKYAQHCNFHNVRVRDGGNDWYIGGVIYSKFIDCAARYNGAARLYAVGWYLDGQISFGYAGGNASVYLDRCLAVVGKIGVDQNNPVETVKPPIGLLAKGSFVDTFIKDFEVAFTSKGMVFDVADQTGNVSATHDLEVTHPVIDGVDYIGMELSLGGATRSAILIDNPYIAAGGGARWGLIIHGVLNSTRGGGFTTVRDGQILGNFTQGSVNLADQTGVTLRGTVIEGGSVPVRCTNAALCKLSPHVNAVTTAGVGPAIEITNSTNMVVDNPIITGDAGVGGGAVGITGGSSNAVILFGGNDWGSYQSGWGRSALKYRATTGDSYTQVSPGAFGVNSIFQGLTPE